MADCCKPNTQKTQTDYLETTKEVYADAAKTPNAGLCTIANSTWSLPGLNIPKIMNDMNYGCGTTVQPRDLARKPRVLYVGVGGGIELLLFSYFSRQVGGVIGIDPVPEMIEASAKNFEEAEKINPWFKKEFVELKMGDARDLPIEDNSIDVAAQNCLFNIFKNDDLEKAISEMYRVLKPGGRLVMSDPICQQPINDTLRNDNKLRALCLSGCITLEEYIKKLSEAGFGTIEVRARKPYRILDPKNYHTDEVIYIESIEVAAIKMEVPQDGASVFTGRNAIYYGTEDTLDCANGLVLSKNQPRSISDKTAAQLKDLNRDDIFISEPTFFFQGGGGSCN